MRQILHGCARTTQAVRRTIQHSQGSLVELSKRYNLNPKTVAKWKKRDFVNDAPPFFVAPMFSASWYQPAS